MRHNNEEIKWIPGFENSYAASRSGKIISFKYQTAKEIKGSVTNKGYVLITLDKKRYSFHRLIALTWIPTDNTSLHIDHIDENKQNNVANNLRWCTQAENNRYYASNELRKAARAERKQEKKETTKKEQTTRQKPSKRSVPKPGNAIMINGTEFISCRDAARYIHATELTAGCTRNAETIRKELRRYQQGLRPSWKMYGKYLVQ